MRYYLRGKAGPLGDSLKAVVQRVIVLKKKQIKNLKNIIQNWVWPQGSIST